MDWREVGAGAERLRWTAAVDCGLSSVTPAQIRLDLFYVD